MKRPPRKGEGRPSKYNPNFIEKVDEYLKQCEDEIEEYHKTRGEKSDTFERIINVNLPTLQGFSSFLGVGYHSLLNWEKENPEFLDALNKVRTAQHNRLVAKALSGEYNHTIAKLMLMHNHGYKEKSDITSNDKTLPTPLLNVIRNHNGNEEIGEVSG